MQDDFVLEPIIVTGQRRSVSTDPFPSMPPPGPWTRPDAIRDNNVRGPTVPACSILPFKSKWNADASAAQAVPQYLARANALGGADVANGIANLLQREFGAFLVRRSGVASA